MVYADARGVLIRITFAKLKSTSNNSINATIEENFCACDNVKFSITK
jgi:hypothetical protein